MGEAIFCNRFFSELCLVLETGGKGIGADSIQMKHAQSIWARCSDTEGWQHHPESEILRSQNHQSSASAAVGWPGRALGQSRVCPVQWILFSSELGQRSCCVPRESCLEAQQFRRGSLPAPFLCRMPRNRKRWKIAVCPNHKYVATSLFLIAEKLLFPGSLLCVVRPACTA